jgi:hypothetical protein
MPGMLARGVMPSTLSWERLTAAERIGETRRPVLLDALPDFDDLATIGCLLALVREAWGEREASARHEKDGWRVAGGWPHWSPLAPYKYDYRTMVRHYARGFATEAEALVAALEAAP